MEEQIREHLETLQKTPGEPDALAAIESHYADGGDWQALVELLEDNAQRLADPERSPGLWVKSAQVYRDQLQREDKAVAALRRALAMDANDKNVLERLRALLAKSQQWVELAEVLERLVVLAGDDKERARQLKELAKIYDEQLGQDEKALTALQGAFQADRSAKSALLRGISIYRRQNRLDMAKQLLDLLLDVSEDENDAKMLADRYIDLAGEMEDQPQLHQDAEDALQKALALVQENKRGSELLQRIQDYPNTWQAKVKDLRASAMDARDKRGAAAHYLAIAQYQWTYGKDADQATQTLEKAFLLVPGFWPAVRFFDVLSRAAGRMDALVERLAKMAGEVTDVRTAVDLYQMVAVLENERGSDEARQIEVFERILELEPSNRNALTALTGFYLDREDFAKAAMVQARFAKDVRDPAERLAAHLTAARLFMTEVGKPELAIEHFAAARSLDGSDHEIIEALDELYAQTGRHAERASLIEQRIAESSENEEKVKYYDMLADLYAERLDDPLLAFQARRQAYALDPREARQPELERLADALVRPADLAQSYLAASDNCDEPSARQRLCLRAAELAGLAEQPNLAREALAKVLADEPENDQALQMLESLVARGDDAKVFAEALEARLLVAKATKERRTILARLARLYVEELRDAERAIERYRAVLELDAKDLEALEALDGLLRKEERWRELAKIVETRINVLGGAEAAELTMRLAKLYEDRLDRPGDALDLYDALHQDAPDRLDVISALERVLSRGVQVDRVASILQPHYARVGAHRRHVEMIELRMQATEEKSRRSALALEAGRIYEAQLRDPREAFRLYCLAFKNKPEDNDLPRELDRLAELAGCHADLVVVLDEVAAQLPESPVKVALAARRASILEDRLGNAEAAIDAHRGLLEQNPGNIESLDALIGLLETSGRYAELVDYLQRRRDFANEAEQAGLDERTGMILIDKLQQIPDGLTLLERARNGADPQVRERVLAKLDQLYTAGEVEEMLLPVLLERAAAAVTTEAAELLGRAGELSFKAGAVAEAVQSFVAALQHDAHNTRSVAGLGQVLASEQSPLALRVQAAEQLEALRRDEGDIPGLLAVLQIRYQGVTEEALRRRLAKEMAEILAGELEQVGQALDLLEAQLTTDPLDFEARGLLERLSFAAGEAERFFALLLSLIEAGAGAEDHARRLSVVAVERGAPQHAIAGLVSLLGQQGDLSWAHERRIEIARTIGDSKALGEALFAYARVATEERSRMLLDEAASCFQTAQDWDQAAEVLRYQLEELEYRFETAESLAELLDQLGQYDDVEALWKEALAELSPERQSLAALRLAMVQMGPLQKQEEAVVAFAQCLNAATPADQDAVRRALSLLDGLARSDNPARGPARQVLAAYYRRQAEARPLIEVLELITEDLEALGDKAKIYDEIATLRIGKAGEETLAFAAASRAYRAEMSPERLNLLRELAQKADSLEAYASLLEESAEACAEQDAQLAASQLREAAALWGTELEDRAMRVRLLQRVLQIVPGDAESLQDLEKVHRESAETDSLVAVLKQKAEAADSPEERFAALLQAARFQVEGEQIEDGIALLRSLHDENNQDTQVLSLLQGALSRRGDDAGVAQVLAQRIDLETEDAEARGLLEIKLGRKLMGLDRYPEALRTLRNAANDRPRDTSLAAAAGELLELTKTGANSEDILAVADLNEMVLRALGSIEDLPPILEIKLESSVDPIERQDLLMEIAHIQETMLGQGGLAFMTACRAVREAPQQLEVMERVESLARRSSWEDEFVDVLEEILEADLAPETSLGMRLRIVDLCANAGDNPRALKHALQGFAQNSNDLSAAKALVRFGRDGESSREIAGALALVAEDHEQQGQLARAKELWLEAAEHFQALEDSDAAVQTLESVLRIAPEDVAALHLLEHLYQGLGRFADLAALLQSQISRQRSSQAKGELMLRLAEIQHDSLQDPIAAAQTLELVALEAPGAVGLMAALERVSQGLQARGGEEAAAVRASIASLLAPRYEASGDTSKLVEILDARLAGSLEDDERRGLLLRVAKLRSEKLGQPEQAYQLLSTALRVHPEDATVRSSVESLASETGDLSGLMHLFEEIADGDIDANLGIEYRRRVASFSRGPMGDPARALDHYEHIFDLMGDPAADDQDRRQVRLQVVEAMEEIARSLQAWSSLGQALRRRAQLDPDEAGRQAALLGLARIQLDELGDAGGALALVRGVLEQEETAEALDLACAAAERQQLFTELVDFLRRRLAIEEDDNRRFKLRYKLGRVLDEDLERGDEAMVEFSAILDEDPGQVETRAYLEQRSQKASGRGQSVTALEQAYAKTGDWKKTIEVLEVQVREAEQRGDMATMRGLLLRIADIDTQHLESPELGFVALTRGLRGERGEEALRARLETMARELETLDNVAEMYEATAEIAADAGRIEVGAELLEAAATLYAFDLNEAERGLELFEKVLAEHPGRLATLAGLDRLYVAQNRFDKLQEILRGRMALTVDDAERIEIEYRLGLLLADRLDLPEDAVPILERVLEHDAKHLGARNTLVDLYIALGQDQKLRVVLESLLADADSAGDEEEALRLHNLLGRLLGEKLEDVSGAIAHWEILLNADASNQEAQTALGGLYERAERFADLRTLLETQISQTTDMRRQSSLQSRLGLLLAEHLGDEATAIERFEKVLERDPRDREALEALRRIYLKVERWDDQVGILRRLLRLQTDATGIKAIRFDLAEVLGTKLDRRSDAIEAGRRILDVEPHSDDELHRLELLFRHCEAWEECADTLDRRVDLAADPVSQIPVLYEVAELWEGPIGRPESAARAYERILAVRPDDSRAYEALSQVYANSNEWRKLVALKEARLNAIESRQENLGLLREIGDIYENRLAQKDLAFLAACRAFREDVLDRECGQWMERLAVDTDSIEELLDVYEDEVQRVSDEVRAIEIHLRMADLAANRLSDGDGAEEHLNRVFEYDAVNKEALEQLFRLYEQGERWEDVVSVLDRKAELAEDLDSKKSLLFTIGQVYEDHLDRPQEAIESYKRVMDLDSVDRRALNNLARLYDELGKDQALIGVLQRLEELEEDGNARIALRLRIAGVWEGELDNAEQAIASHRIILDQDPANNVSLKALERIYTQLDRMSEVLGIYEKQVAIADTVDEQVRLLGKIAAIWEERFENVEQAVAATERILLIAPSNEAATKNLERLFRQTANWQRLIDVMRAHIELTRDPEEIVGLFLDIGEIFYRELNLVDKAEEMYTAALDFDPRSRRAIHALGQLYERSGNWFNALEKLAQEVDILGAESEAVEIHFRMGKINEDMLLDAGSARASYERALDLDPTFIPAIKALKDIHYSAKQYEDYLRYQDLEAQFVDDAEEKTDLYTQSARFLQDRLADIDGAFEQYEQALIHSPTSLAAAVPAADIAFRKENFERARELLEIVVEGLDANEQTQDLVRHQYRLGYVYQRLENEAEALRAYQRAFELDSTYLPALEGYGQALVQAQRYEEAQKVYQTLLIHHKDFLTDAEVVDYYWQLGDVSRHLEQNERALRNLEKALELDPGHAPSLRLLGEVSESDSNFEEAYDAYTQLADLLSGEDRLKLLLHIGRLSRSKLDDAYRSIDSFEDALRLDSSNKEVLEALYELYQETRQGPRAAEILEELIRVEPDEQTRVRLNYNLGELYRDELKNDVRAVQYFNAALDLDPSYVRAFEAIEKLLTQRKQWVALEENYRAMIQRTPKESIKVRSVLWKNLGELYLRVLKNLDAAIAAYNVLCRIVPNNAEHMETLAELMSRSPSQIEGAIGTYQQLVPLAEDPSRACHALHRLYLSRQLHDRAYCACSALRLLRQADEEEQKLYAYYNKYAPQKAQRALTDRLWEALLVHPLAQGHLATVSALIYKHAGVDLLEDPKELGLAKKKDWARVGSGLYFSNQLKYVNQVLNTPQFEIYAKRKSDSALSLLPTAMPTLGVGEHNDLFKEVPPRQVWFIAGRMLTYMRPAFILPFVLGPQEFGAVVDAALLFAEPRFQSRSDPEEIARISKRMQRVRQPLGEALRPVLKKILTERKRPDINSYFEGVEFTAIRAAHLMCGDIDTSAKILRVRDPGQFQLQNRAKMQEVLEFMLSEAYFELRTRLGLAIRGQA